MWLVGRRVLPLAFRKFSTSCITKFKVAVCGAGGGIGQPLSLLMKLNPMVSELNVYDIVGTPGVAADLSHIDTYSTACGYVKSEQLKQALQCADIVIISAGLPRKPGMTRDDLFNKNAGIVKEIICSAAVSCPNAFIAIITNPVNSVVPIAAEILKENNCYDPNRLFGVTTLDVVRSRKFISTILDCDPRKVSIPVIGGHSGETIIPVLSQCKPKYNNEVEKLTKRIQDAGTEVVKAKAGAGSATLSMAYAAAQFGNSLLKALCGEDDIVECSYVESCVTEASFFATPILIGKNGMEENLGLPKLNDYEKKLLKKALPQLKGHIKKGVDFVKCGGGGK